MEGSADLCTRRLPTASAVAQMQDSPMRNAQMTEQTDAPGFLLSIMLPVYNERSTIQSVLDAVLAAPLPDGVSREVVIIDDGSTDGTREYLQAVDHPEVRLVCHEQNTGKGGAIRTSLEHIKGDWLLIQDADLEYQVSDYPALLAPLLAGTTCPIVFGSRFLGHIEGMHWANRLANRLLTLATNVLYGCRITDLCTGYKLYRTSELEGMVLERTGFDLEHEITAKLLRLDHDIIEVPITYRGRNTAEGKKVRWQDFFIDLHVLVKVRFG